MCSLDPWNTIHIFLYFLVLFIHSASIYFMPVVGQTLHILGEKQVAFLLSLSLLSSRILDVQQITTQMKTMSACAVVWRKMAGAPSADSVMGAGAVRESLSEKAPWKPRPEVAEKAEPREKRSLCEGELFNETK